MTEAEREKRKVNPLEEKTYGLQIETEKKKSDEKTNANHSWQYVLIYLLTIRKLDS